MITLSNILIKAEPDDYLEPINVLSKVEAQKLLQKFIPIRDRHPDRWFRAMTASNGKSYIVTGIGSTYESMMEFYVTVNPNQ